MGTSQHLHKAKRVGDPKSKSNQPASYATMRMILGVIFSSIAPTLKSPQFHQLRPSISPGNRQTPRFPKSSPDIRLGDLTKACQRLMHHSPHYGLLWNALGTLPWHIWFERNRRLKQHMFRPSEILFKEIIRDISRFFSPENYRKSCCLPLEIATMQKWETILLIYIQLLYHQITQSRRHISLNFCILYLVSIYNLGKIINEKLQLF